MTGSLRLANTLFSNACIFCSIARVKGWIPSSMNKELTSGVVRESKKESSHIYCAYK